MIHYIESCPPIDISALLDATADLEVGHPIEAVLRAHGMPDRWSAYEVVDRYQKYMQFSETAPSAHFQSDWQSRVNNLRPCVAAIAAWFAENPRL